MKVLRKRDLEAGKESAGRERERTGLAAWAAG